MTKRHGNTTARRGTRQAGSAILEGALTITAFFMMIFGILDFGRMLWIYNTMGYIAREGSRYAMVRGINATTPATSSSIQTFAAARAIGLDPAAITITSTWTPVGYVPLFGATANKVGDKVKVQASYTFTTIVPYIPFASVNLKSDSTAYIRN